MNSFTNGVPFTKKNKNCFLGKVSIKKTLKVMEFSINFFRKKKCFFHKKYKDDQNGIIHPEK